MGALSTPASPDISSSYEHGLPALLAGDAVHRELGNVVTAVGVNLRQLGGEKRERCNEAAASLHICTTRGCPFPAGAGLDRRLQGPAVLDPSRMERALCCETNPAWHARPHLYLQLHDIVHGPSLVVVVIVGDGGEAAGPLLVRDAALGEVLG